MGIGLSKISYLGVYTNPQLLAVDAYENLLRINCEPKTIMVVPETGKVRNAIFALTVQNYLEKICGSSLIRQDFAFNAFMPLATLLSLVEKDKTKPAPNGIQLNPWNMPNAVDLYPPLSSILVVSEVAKKASKPRIDDGELFKLRDTLNLLDSTLEIFFCMAKSAKDV